MVMRDCRVARGVTLIELLVVLVIVSVAIAVVMPSVGSSYENWVLRSTGRRTVALFRQASDLARRDGTDLAGSFEEHRFVLFRKASVLKQLEIPASIRVEPEKSKGVVFLSTGQIIASEPFVLENQRGRRMTVELGPRPGQVTMKETMR